MTDAVEKTDGMVDGRIPANDFHHLAQLTGQRLEGHALIRAQAADDHAGILAGKKSLGHNVVQINVKSDGGSKNQEHQGAVRQRLVERAPVAGVQGVEPALSWRGDFLRFSRRTVLCLRYTRCRDFELKKSGGTFR